MKTFLITTHHNKDTRHRYIKEHLKGVDYIPILAPDWKMFRHTGLNDKQYKQQSLTLAYYQIAQTALFLNLKEFTIMEDDLNITDWKMLDELYENIPEHFDVCYLTRTDHNIASAMVKEYSHHFSKIVNNWWETPITHWSERFARNFVFHIEQKLEEGLWLGHVDHELLQINYKGSVNFYGSNFQIAQGISTSKQPGLIGFEGSICNDLVK